MGTAWLNFARLGLLASGMARLQLVRRCGALHFDPFATDAMVIILLEGLGHRSGAVRARQEAHEAKAARAVRGRVDHHHSVGHDAVLLEVLPELPRTLR